jgi:hypothetical protein
MKKSGPAVTAKPPTPKGTRASTPTGGEYTPEEGELAIANALSTLGDILTALKSGDNLQAEALGEYLRDCLAGEANNLRAEMLAHIHGWITAYAGGLGPTINELVGLRPDPRSPKQESADIREGLILQNLEKAEQTTNGPQRDEYIAAAIRSLAQLPPLAVARLGNEFSRFGIEGETLKALLEAEQKKTRSNGAEAARDHLEAFINALPIELQDKFRAQVTAGITQHLGSAPHLEAFLPPLKLIASDDLQRREFKPPVWVVPAYLPAGLTILAGRPKVGKSWLALQICQSVAHGGKVFDRDVERGQVLYLALEDHARRLQNRMQAQNWPANTTGVDFMLADAFREQIQHLNSGGGLRLAKHIRERNYRLVVVDTLSRALKGDQKDESDMTAAIAPLQETALALEIAIVLIDHHKKPMGAADPNPIDDILGSTAKGAVADAAWGLYREQGKRGAKLAITGRDVDEVTLKLAFDVELHCWQSEGEAYEIERTERRQEILDALKLLMRAQVKDVADAIGQPKGNTHYRLQDLVNAGLVIRAVEGANVFYSLPGQPKPPKP